MLLFKLSPTGSKRFSSVNEDENNTQGNENFDPEVELDKFESLLNTVSQFRPRTSGVSREERFNHAEVVAKMFEKLLMQDKDEPK